MNANEYMIYKRKRKNKKTKNKKTKKQNEKYYSQIIFFTLFCKNYTRIRTEDETTVGISKL
jgi:hypothetical protein